MNLKDFANSANVDSLRNILNREFGLDITKVPEEKIEKLKESVHAKLNAFRSSKAFHESEKSEAYLALLTAQKVLESYDQSDEEYMKDARELIALVRPEPVSQDHCIDFARATGTDPDRLWNAVQQLNSPAVLDENDEAHNLLTGFGFRKGNTIAQSPENRLTVYHGRGPLGSEQHVAVTPKTFSHVSHPGTSNAIVHARLQPIAGLKDHMIKHWSDAITNGLKESVNEWSVCWSEKKDGKTVYNEKEFFTEAARTNFCTKLAKSKAFLKFEAFQNADGQIVNEAGFGDFAHKVAGGISRAASVGAHGLSSVAGAAVQGFRGKALDHEHGRLRGIGGWEGKSHVDPKTAFQKAGLKPVTADQLNQIMAQLQRLSPQHRDAVLNAIKQTLQPAQQTTATTPTAAPTSIAHTVTPAPTAPAPAAPAAAAVKKPAARKVAPTPKPAAKPSTQTQMEVFSALQNVGYKKPEAGAAIRSALEVNPQFASDFDNLMRASLQYAKKSPQFQR